MKPHGEEQSIKLAVKTVENNETYCNKDTRLKYKYGSSVVSDSASRSLFFLLSNGTTKTSFLSLGKASDFDKFT